MKQPSPAFWAQAAQRYEEIRRGERREPRATELIADVHGGRLTRSDLVHRVGFEERIRERRTAGSQHRRESRPTPTRRRGSRRAGASSRTSSADPPDDDPDPEPQPARTCGACDCDESLIGKAPQARFCSDACRKAASRGVFRVPVKPPPTWSEAELLGTGEVDLLYELGRIMEEGPGGPGRPARKRLQAVAV